MLPYALKVSSSAEPGEDLSYPSFSDKFFLNYYSFSTAFFQYTNKKNENQVFPQILPEIMPFFGK